MSLLPAYVSARLRKDDSAPQAEADRDSPIADTPFADPHGDDFRRPDSHATDLDDKTDLDDNVFNLLPPAETDHADAVASPPPPPQGRNKHPVDMTDLSRLSIDRDGKLYWDGKPVETHHRLAMSRRQIVGAGIVAAFVIIGAALQATAAARDWACRLGWSSSACALPGVAPRRASDIPA